MRFSRRDAAFAMLAFVLASCSESTVRNPTEVTTPRLATLSAPRPPHFSEIHYDNAGTDTGEAIEVTAPAGMDLTGWKIVLYNGSGGAVYGTTTLSGSVPATCGSEGVVVVNYASNGIQNGSPDGMALVDATGALIEFLSYEGTFTGVGGAANGVLSTDIGASEAGTSADSIGLSLQRNGFGGWDARKRSTFGACNDQPAAYEGPTSVVISEIMGDPLAALSATWGEWFEVYNYGTEPVNLGGWKLRSGGQPDHTISGDVVVPPGGYAVLGRGADESKNGYVALDYNYFNGNTTTTIWLDASDWLALKDPTGGQVDSVAWTSLPKGASRAVRDLSADNTDVNGANWGYSTEPFGSGDFGTPGAPNGTLSDVAPPVPTGIVRLVFSGRDGSDPALPVGFEDQLFVFGVKSTPDTVRTGFTWSSATPALASVDQDGVVHALAAGTAVLRATSADGRVGLYRVATRVATPSGTAAYADNLEFGRPADSDPSDDYLVVRPQYTISYSAARNTPNWVSYEMEATHFGAEDRCDCFTADPELPSSFTHLTTADYTGAGAVAGYGIDRGHLVRSADRTAGSLDNAYTFLLSNIIPQAADLNQGPWANLENYLGNFARDGTHEVYVVAGVAGEKGTVKGAGKIVIPENVWKVAVIMPRDEGLADVHAATDFQLVAVDMPNVPGIKNVDWHSYQTTVDAIEAESGYDLLSKLPDHIEWLVEAGLTSPGGASADELITILSAGVRSLAAQGGLSEGEATSLIAKLSAAQGQLGRESEAVAGQIRAFINEVAAMQRSGRLSSEEAGSLGTFARWILAAVG